jgi:hypothetical protein
MAKLCQQPCQRQLLTAFICYPGEIPSTVNKKREMVGSLFPLYIIEVMTIAFWL